MNPVEVLMEEHRLIERVVALLGRISKQSNDLSESETGFLTAVIDFFRMYADHTHHGKEEGILFRELDKKQLSAAHAEVMKSLISEHVYAREVTQRLSEAQFKFSGGNSDSVPEIRQCIKDLVTLYPFHIEKEETRFFHVSFEYLSLQEQQAMLEEFKEFDQSLVHEKYQRIVETLEKSSPWIGPRRTANPI